MNPMLFSLGKMVILLFYMANLLALLVAFPSYVDWLFPLSGALVVAIHAVQLAVLWAWRTTPAPTPRDALGVLLYGMLHIRAITTPTLSANEVQR